MPACTVIPELTYPDVEEAARWLTRVFEFRLRISIGGHRAQMHAGDGAIVLTESVGTRVSNGAVLMRVEDIDKHYARTVAAGCTVIRDLADCPYGERQYSVVDFAGNRWTFSQTIADVAPEEWGGVSVALD